MKIIGVSDNPIVIEELCRQGQAFIHKLQLKQQPQLLELRSSDSMKIESFLQSLSNLNVRTVGPKLIFGTIFDRIGFDSVPDSLFRHLVVSRLVFPVSKVKTVDYLRRYTGQEISVDRNYCKKERYETVDTTTEVETTLFDIYVSGGKSCTQVIQRVFYFTSQMMDTQ